MPRNTKKPVQDTNDSSITSKASMVRAGYFRDDFAHCFSEKCSQRTPLINRGYFIRAEMMDYCLRRFLSKYENKSTQIVSLGAGHDSTYFRLSQQKLLLSCKYYEIDFEPVLQKKLGMIRRHNLLPETPDFKNDKALLSTDLYCLIPFDLAKNLSDLTKILTCFDDFSFKIPTLFLSEVVLCYLKTIDSDSVLTWITKHFSNNVCVLYEQVIPDDAFGSFMRKHFNKLQSTLWSLEKYPSFTSQELRMKAAGFDAVHIIGLHEFYYECLSAQQRKRIDTLEPFDEFEEWNLKCGHYICICAENGENQIFHNLYESSPAIPVKALTPTKDKPLQFFPRHSDAISARFAHSVVHLSTPNVIVVSGGCAAISGQRHQRSDSLAIVDLAEDSIVEERKDEVRMFGKMAQLDENSVMVFGGRKSPMNPNNLGVKIVCYNDDSESEIHGKQPSARWRHSLTSICVDGKYRVVLFGGLTTNHIILSDCFYFQEISKLSYEWCKISENQEHPSGRHSHSATCWDCNKVVMTGGLTEDGELLGDIHVLDGDKWKKSNIQIVPRYSHTSHTVGDLLLLVGGITLCPVQKIPYHSGVTTVHLLAGVTRNFPLPSFDLDKEIFMLHSHASILLEKCYFLSFLNKDLFHGQLAVEDGDNSLYVLVIGGGGNCFSFGTHCNQSVMIIPVGQFLCEQ